MAAAYRNSTSANTGSTPASTLAVSVPSGIVVNDIMFVLISVDGGTNSTITAPSGWTLVKSVTQATNTRASIYWKVVDGYEANSYTWTFDTTRQAAGVMIAYSGALPFVPSSFASLANGTASATVNATGVNSTYETGLSVQFIAARNTTGAATITASGTYTKRVDTCTTASTFMEATVTDATKGLTMGGTTASAPTCSQTVTSVFANLFLEDARPAFASLMEDEFVVGSNATSVTSVTSAAQLQTNYPNEVLLLFGTINKDATTISSVTGGGLTWVLVGRANTNAGSVELWRAFAPTPITGQQITVNFAASVVSFNYMIVGFVGADLTGAIGAFATASSTAAAPTVSLTTTRNNSWVWGATSAPTTGSMTAGTNQTVLRNQNDTTNTAQGWMQRQNAITATSGTSVTINSTSPSTANCNTLAVEILPAVYHQLGTTGAGV